MTNVFIDILFESVHAAIIGTIFFYLLVQGKKFSLHHKNGWHFILTGFALLFLGTVVDITDNFPALNRFIFIGDTRYEAFLEKVIGYTIGSMLLAIGFWKFLPAVFALRESEQRLRVNEERLRKIIEMGPISMAIVALTGKIEYINRRSVETFGYLPEDIPDMDHWWTLAYPDETYRAETLAQWMSLVEKAFAGNMEIERREYQVTCKDRTIKTMLIFGVLVSDKVFVMFEDITERKRAEEALLQSERFLQETQEVAGLGTYIFDLIAGTWESSVILCRIFGLDEAEERTFADWCTLVHPVERQAMIDYFNNEVLAARGCFDREYRIITNSERIEKWVHGRGELKLDTEGRPIRMIGTISDITERKMAQEEIRRLNSSLEALVAARTEELIRSNRDLSSFCYAISHELRAPVARLRGLSEALQEELTENPAEAEHYTRRIILASGQLQQVIDSVLQLSRLPQSTFTPHLLNVSELALEILTRLASETPDRTMEIIVADNITASGDATLLRLCLENLLGNAVKYTNHQPVARIEFGLDADSGAMFVRDNGVGFNMAYAEKLFEPFIRLHREDDFAGSGIGLATVQRIIERHGGRIWAESAPQEGATFYFTLNAAQGEHI